MRSSDAPGRRQGGARGEGEPVAGADAPALARAGPRHPDRAVPRAHHSLAAARSPLAHTAANAHKNHS